MSPVNRAGSVSEISPRHLSFVKISMCSYETPGWPGYRQISTAKMAHFICSPVNRMHIRLPRGNPQSYDNRERYKFMFHYFGFVS